MDVRPDKIFDEDQMPANPSKFTIRVPNYLQAKIAKERAISDSFKPWAPPPVLKLPDINNLSQQ